MQRRLRPQQIPRILCWSLVEHLGQDVSSIDNRAAFHCAVPGPEWWHDDAEGQQTQFREETLREANSCLVLPVAKVTGVWLAERGGVFYVVGDIFHGRRHLTGRSRSRVMLADQSSCCDRSSPPRALARCSLV